ncbi:TPA: RHS repeat protein [Pseudomonas aeruginosa]|nr:RHS repeat protein [Pseudomonas aeruginosa]MCS7704314.1 RHS repeat protein [Pseudomonas aeruginosa]MEA8475164.1 RHS repeat protein [Pseudomonas aeruginosa]
MRSVSEKYYSVVLENGKEEFFTKNGVEYKSTRKDSGTLTKSASAWRYKSMNGEQYKFNKNGEIAEKIDRENRRVIFTKKPEWIEARDDFGRALKIKEDKAGQPLTVEAPGLSIQYTYKEGMLLSVSKYRNEAATETRSYHYEDLNNAKLLTGITDERGIRYATWAYDNQGRAISSVHANGAEKVTLAYNDDGSTTVTNEYGKQATYRFQVIQGIKRIVAIEGEPSPNCPSSNSTFTYDERGLLTSKRDNNGNLTTYQYNARGLETTRTEAAGTAQARTITTDWHPTLFLPVQVSEPGRITRYQYDAEGRKTGETVTTR